MSNLSKKEQLFLANYAVKSNESKGRHHKEILEKNRLCFQLDKDRIIHCKTFRRLDEKTQVFMAGTGDHYRTRLTHTLEVAQISRSIARRLDLNEDLCEAIALAHDLGHPPFGHAGEDALNEIMQEFGMHFEHNEQSKRVVEFLEKVYPNFDGLNLSIEVLEGLMKHQTAFDQQGKIFEVFPHLEAQVVNIADEIAYTNHDMDDGLRSEIFDLNELKKFRLWQDGEKAVFKKYGKIKDKDVLVFRIISNMIGLMIEDFCNETEKNLKKYKIRNLKDVKNFRGQLANFSVEMRLKIAELRTFLFQTFYMHPSIVSVTLKGKRMIHRVFEFYYKNPDKFPKSLKKNVSEKQKIIAIKDYLAGMTDRFLGQEYKKMLKG